MKKIIISLLAAMVLILGFNNIEAEAATAGSGKMTIHAIYLASAEDEDPEAAGGDATIVQQGKNLLLMDTGADDTAGATIISYIKSLGYSSTNKANLSIYISHLHLDHYGGYEYILNHYSSCANLVKIYVPYISIASDYVSGGVDYATNYVSKFVNPAESAGVDDKLVGLYCNSSDIYDPDGTDDTISTTATEFNIGTLKVEIIGPVYNIVNSSNQMTMAQFESQDGVIGTTSGHYLNNRSLVARITDGTKTFLTAGDIEVDEEEALLTKYGSSSSSKLNADIFKMNHHGLATSNSEDFVAAVSPSWTYAQNSAQTGLASITNDYGITVRKTYTQRATCAEYGFVCMVGDEAKNFVIANTGSGVSMKLGSTTLGSGWVTMQGSYGVGITTDKYYLNSDGSTKTGVQTISGKTYYLGNGGCLEMGYVSTSAKKSDYYTKISGTSYYYNMYRSYGSKVRYFPSYSTGVMQTGFATIGDGTFYFIKSTGYRKESSASGDNFVIVTIGSNSYAMKNNGYIYTDGLIGIASEKKYVCASGTNGALITGFKTIDGNKYYFTSSFYSKLPSTKDGTFYSTKIGSNYYAMKSVKKNGCYLGYIYKGGLVTLASEKTYAYASSSGKLAKGLKTVSGTTYYFDSKGVMVLPEKLNSKFCVTKLGSKYYAVKSKKKNGVYLGIVYTTNGVVSIQNKGYAYIGSKGYLKSGWQKGYYYSPETYMRSGSTTKISSVSGKAKKVTVKWKKASQASGYYVYRSTKKSSGYKKIKTITSKSTLKYKDTSAKKGNTYYYKVSAYYKVKVGSKTTNWEGPLSSYKKYKVTK
ncbi:MAG: hypothetical protein K6E13_01360 [Lachnospiraceae bacterium]|nr:hypothetical protein [Lachnospiraceae bacterium]